MPLKTFLLKNAVFFGDFRADSQPNAQVVKIGKVKIRKNA